MTSVSAFSLRAQVSAALAAGAPVSDYMNVIFLFRFAVEALMTGAAPPGERDGVLRIGELLLAAGAFNEETAVTCNR